jgi:hypothetical protein
MPVKLALSTTAPTTLGTIQLAVSPAGALVATEPLPLRRDIQNACSAGC